MATATAAITSCPGYMTTYHWARLVQVRSESFIDLFKQGRRSKELIASQARQFDGTRTQKIYGLIKEPSRILDLGCGYLEHVAGGPTQCLYEPTTYVRKKEFVKFWRGYDVPLSLANHRVRSGNIVATQERSESYDEVILNRVLNAKERESILREALRVLKVGGHIRISYPKPNADRKKTGKEELDFESMLRKVASPCSIRYEYEAQKLSDLYITVTKKGGQS